MTGDLLSGAAAIVIMCGVLALIYWVTTGLSPWPVFLLAEAPGAGFGFILLSLSTPHRY